MKKDYNFIDEKLRHSVLMIRTLHMIKLGKKAYPYDLLKRMKDKNNPMFCDLSKNDIYNAISALENKGLIVDVGAKGEKKYYRITKRGTDLLNSSKTILIKHLKAIQKMFNEG